MKLKIIKKAMSFLMVLAVMSSTLAAPVYNIGTVLVNAEDAPITEPVSEENTSSEIVSEDVNVPVSEESTSPETITEEVIAPDKVEPTTPTEPVAEEPTTYTEPISVEPATATTQASDTQATTTTTTNTNSISAPEITPMATTCREDTNNSSAPHLTSIEQVGQTEEIRIVYSGSGSTSNPTILPGYEITSISFFIPPEANGGEPSDVVIGPIMADDFLTPLNFETGPSNAQTTSFMLPTTNREALRDHMKKNGKFELKYEITMTNIDDPTDCVTHKTTDTKKLVYIPVIPTPYTSSILFAYEEPAICSPTGIGSLDLTWSYSDTLIGVENAIVEIYLDGVLLDGSTFAPSDSDPGIRDNAITASPGEHYVSITVTNATDPSIIYTFANNFFTVPEATIPLISTFSATPSADGMSIDVIADIDLNSYLANEVTASITVTTPDGAEPITYDFTIAELADLPPYPVFMGGTYIFDLTINYNDRGTDCAKTAAARADMPLVPPFIEVYPSEQNFCAPNNQVDIFWYYDPGYADQDVYIEVSIDGDLLTEEPIIPDEEGFGEFLNYGPLADGEHEATITILDGETSEIIDENTFTFTTPMLINPEITEFSATAGKDMNVLLDYEIDLGSIFEVPAFLFNAQLEVTGPNGYSDTVAIELDEFDFITTGHIDYKVPKAGTYEFTLTLNYEDEESSCAITTQSTTVTVKEKDTLAYTGLETSRFEAFIINLQEMFKW